VTAPLPPLAMWHGLTGPCVTCGFVHLSFDLVYPMALDLRTRGVVRLRLSGAAAREVMTVLQNAYASPRHLYCPECAVQSESSSGNPTLDVSSGGEVGNV
jgi:hypothetical protein